jgi:hypothetical protein
MTGRETPSPDSAPRLLEEAGIAEDQVLVHAVRSIAALGGRPAPDASVELAQLMADGGRAPQSRRNKRRITFIGGALAVSMGAGMSGVAAGTLHLRHGFDDAVVSITRFTVRNDVDRAESTPGPLADAGHGHGPAVVPAVPAPAHAPAPPTSASAPSAPADAGGPPVQAPAPASPGADVAAAARTAPPVVSPVRPPAGTVLPADPATPAPDGSQPRAVPVAPPATGTAPGPTGRPDQARAGQGRPGQAKPGPVAPGQAKSGPVAPGQAKPGQGRDRSLPKETTETGPEMISGDTPAPADHRRSWLRAPAGPADASFLLDAPVALDPEWLALFPADALLGPEDPVPGLPVEPAMGELPAEPAPEEPPAEPAPEDALPVEPVDPEHSVGPAEPAAPDSSGSDVAVPEAATPEAGSRSVGTSHQSD